MESVFKYFEEIMKIPRESGKEDKIAQYIIDYAKNHNIEYYLGKYNTVFLRKNNHSNNTIILQAHSDMVCVSNNNYDFENKGIPFFIDGDSYKSKCTSLGADDGIGIALILAILEENNNMPNIEVMITTQEETTMLGALNFDYSLITGKTLISLDGIKEGDIESSSAGMSSIILKKNINYSKCDKKNNTYRLSIKGLAGGHSGDDIDKNRCNGIKLIIKILKSININKICDINIGKSDNVIPSDGYVIFTSESKINEINYKINEIDLKLNKDDLKFEFKIEQINNKTYIDESKEIISLLDTLENGLIETYPEDGFPILSSNIGKVTIENGVLTIKYSIRSSDKAKEEQLLNKTNNISKLYGFEFILDANKPFFPYKENSKIRNLLFKSYKELYGKEPIIKKVHACMEGGILSNNIKNLDICTIAPTIENCHSINEKVSISSTKRVYNWLKDTLIRFNNKR